MQPDLVVSALPVASLVPYAENARTHSPAQVAQIAASIAEFGFVNPVLVDAEGVLIAGHGRVMAAKQLGLASVPVLRLGHLSPAQQRALLLADNKIAANAGWDHDLLIEELEILSVELPDIGIELDVTGFDSDEIEALVAAPRKDRSAPSDTPPAPDVFTVSRLGDVWQLGPHRILCGDARSVTAMDQLMANRIARMFLTDPPYNVRINGHVRGRGQQRFEEFAFASGEMTTQEYTAFLEAAIANMVRHLCDGGLGYYFIDWRHLQELTQAAMAHFAVQKNLVVWDKRTPGQGSFYRNQHELCAVFKLGNAAHVNNIGLGKHRPTRSNIWTYAGVAGFRSGRAEDLAMHPTVKPLAMMCDAIIDASSKGECVVDPFLGSGTTLMAAEHTGRHCHGMEFDRRYVDVAVRRWQDFTHREAVLVGDGRTWRELRDARRAEAGAAAAKQCDPKPSTRTVVPRVQVLAPHLRAAANSNSPPFINAAFAGNATPSRDASTSREEARHG